MFESLPFNSWAAFLHVFSVFRVVELTLFQVYDRCRGVDNDPVEPDPTPSRVSSQLSLVPLITPAHCLGKPGEVRGKCMCARVWRSCLLEDCISRKLGRAGLSIAPGCCCIPEITLTATITLCFPVFALPETDSGFSLGSGAG